MAGTIPGFSLTPQFDQFGKIAPGCRLYTIAAGTTSTPQNSYQDTGLTILNPNPLIGDSTGRLPQFFISDGVIKLRLTDSKGTQLFVGDNLLVVGASSGGGGGSPVDPTTVLQTGQLALWYGTGVQSGFVRANGRSIGSSLSSATERANADTQALYSFLWNADPNLAVSGGRGASAAADWAANKNIALPDYRGRAIAGLDDMGNTAAGRLTATYFGTAATVLGAAGGLESRILTLAQLPTGITSRNAAQAISVLSVQTNIPYNTGLDSGGGTGFTYIGGAAPAIAGQILSTTNSADINVTSNNTGGAAHATASPMMLATIYIKL